MLSVTEITRFPLKINRINTVTRTQAFNHIKVNTKRTVSSSQAPVGRHSQESRLHSQQRTSRLDPGKAFWAQGQHSPSTTHPGSLWISPVQADVGKHLSAPCSCFRTGRPTEMNSPGAFQLSAKLTSLGWESIRFQNRMHQKAISWVFTWSYKINRISPSFYELKNRVNTRIQKQLLHHLKPLCWPKLLLSFHLHSHKKIISPYSVNTQKKQRNKRSYNMYFFHLIV